MDNKKKITIAVVVVLIVVGVFVLPEAWWHIPGVLCWAGLPQRRLCSLFWWVGHQVICGWWTTARWLVGQLRWTVAVNPWCHNCRLYEQSIKLTCTRRSHVACWCHYTGMSVLWHWRLSAMTLVCQSCDTGVSVLWHWHVGAVTLAFKCHDTGVSELWHWRVDTVRFSYLQTVNWAHFSADEK